MSYTGDSPAGMIDGLGESNEQGELTNPPRSAPGVRTYSSWFRSALSFGAIVTAILPAAVVFFRLLPAYSIQMKFLIFYGPLVCFLTLAYLFYIRDALARAMFADLLNPSPDPDPYYGEPTSASLRRIARRARSLVLALLPVVLVLTSSYCAVEYFRLVNRSVGDAVEEKMRQPGRSGELGGLGESRRGASSRKAKGSPSPKSSRSAPADTAAVAVNADSLREYILVTAKLDDIPSFLRLNVLFLGIFLSAEIAFILMALKEYAKEAMGLTERDLMLGPNSAALP